MGDKQQKEQSDALNQAWSLSEDGNEGATSAGYGWADGRNHPRAITRAVTASIRDDRCRRYFGWVTDSGDIDIEGPVLLFERYATRISAADFISYVTTAFKQCYPKAKNNKPRKAYVESAIAWLEAPGRAAEVQAKADERPTAPPALPPTVSASRKHKKFVPTPSQKARWESLEEVHCPYLENQSGKLARSMMEQH